MDYGVKLKKITTIIDIQILFNITKKMNFYQKFMNIIWNYYLEEVEMVYIVKILMKNLIINLQQTTLFRNYKGNIFGEYLPIPWKIEGRYQKNQNNCFIFTLTNIYDIQPTKFESKKKGNTVYFDGGHSPFSI